MLHSCLTHMASAHIRARTLKDGTRRFDVRFRRGGRGYPVEHAGTFKTRKLAVLRHELVAGWIAAGLDPRRQLRNLHRAPVTGRFAVMADAWLASRIDLDDSTVLGYRYALVRSKQWFNGAAAGIEPDDVNDWVRSMVADGLAASSVAQNVRVLRMVLDVLPDNAARSLSVVLPRQDRRTLHPPDADEVVAVIERLSVRYRLAAVTLEQAGLRVSEAIGLRDDVADGRLLVRAEQSKTDRARFVPVAGWLEPLLVGRPLAGVERTAFGNAMRRASERAGVANINPHLLRHRRASLWHQSGMPAVELAYRLGHAKPSMSLDTYLHVRPLHEADPGQLLASLNG